MITRKDIEEAMEVAYKQMEKDINIVSVYSNKFDMYITNPFIDEVGLEEFDYKAACDYYGVKLVNDFIEICKDLKEIKE